MHIVMVAAENDALPGGKVGGLGDVVRDLPIALADLGHRVTVVCPGYGSLSRLPGANLCSQFDIDFAHRHETVALFEVSSPKIVHPQVTQLVLEHPLFAASGVGMIYCQADREPYATDASKFALFSAAVSEAIVQGLLGDIDVVHCHDWHTAAYFMLREYSPRYHSLKSIASVFSIHNIALQGVRPLFNHESSLEHWFPDLPYESEKISDPHHDDCVNFMRACINLADRINTVSPTYAEEILRPSDWAEGNVGGEGLERDLLKASQENRLFGILNGCDYASETPEVDKLRFSNTTIACLDQWAAATKNPPGSFYYALRNLERWRRKSSKQARPILVSIGRMTTQKLGLLSQAYKQHTVLEEILVMLRTGIYVMMGSGDDYYDQFFSRVAADRKNFLYLNGYSDTLANSLYAYGDLFLMPSIFEPCGISQMLAMRGGMPCIVNATGGLKDTVAHDINGFVFSGLSMAEKVTNLIATTALALEVYGQQPDHWARLVQGAKAAHFSWHSAAKAYQSLLYSPLVDGSGGCSQ